MIDQKNFEFSFSGLKTAVLKEASQLKTMKQFSHLAIQELAYEIQEAITDVLVEKTLRAAQKYKVKSILLAGGVAANDLLRKKLLANNYQPSAKFFVPPKNLCTDNAAIVASCAYFNYKPVSWQKIQANPSLEIEEMIK